ncbi:DNA helicase MCM8 isoform X2 [Anabrus simplex]|uniref:DNA helicase MCM8 isoform X2 n=1 Tax=Anabrus simplex TaxID=316456 RepID=UPI0035A2B502
MESRTERKGKYYRQGRGGSYGKHSHRPVNKSTLPGHNIVYGHGPSRGPAPSSSKAPFSEHGTYQKTLDSFEIVPIPYDGWKQYFPQEGYQPGSATVAKVKAMETFIRKSIKLYSATDIMERRAFSVDIKSLITDEEFSSSWPTFQVDLSENAEHSLCCLGLAMHQVVVSEIKSKLKARVVEDNQQDLPAVTVPIIRARIMNYEPIIQLKNIKTNYYGKLVSVRGTIMRVGNIKLLCTWMAFECNTCHGMQCVKQPEGIFTEPTKCTTDGCKARSFSPLLSSPYTQTINWRSVRLQELVADDQREGGRVPRTVECEITEDLLDSCVPGDVVTLVGIVKVRNNEETTKRKAPSMFMLYIDAVSVVNNKNQSSLGRNSAMGVKLEVKDLCAIKDISSQPSLFKLLVNSLCPTIYGHELVKAGLLLALFGGSQHHKDGRCDPHVLVVGDPGLGKSQMLQACSSVAPRGMYVCGNTSTSSGLTVTLSRESGGDYALEAGALVLADQGCCCIDEFDKMTNQHQALLEAMEQQSISIAKAGVVCSLPARTSILAAANPSGGHYNRAKTVSENLRIGSALLSRFDLVFILLDQPDEQLDNLLSEHVMGIHSGINPKINSQPSALTSSAEYHSGSNGNPSLRQRLKLGLDETLEPIPHLLLRKYIAYARKYIQPKLSPPAANILQRFYLELRRQHQAMDSTPITTRQLESMIRLSEARAKLELRDEVLETDALDIVELMKYSLVDTLNDGCGGLDFQRSQHGSGMSSKNQLSSSPETQARKD